VGQFRAYVRASNGLEYIINPEEMQAVTLPISYVSRTGQLETITFTCGITTPVSNATARESIDEIKQRAPARYYTQNRMVNGEDYNNFPFTAYNSILKSKALNRASIGTSRYLELVDNTGKYASTNVFSSDGALYEAFNLPSFQFTFLTNNEISSVITNQVQPLLAQSQSIQFYYSKFPRPSLVPLNVGWNLSTSLAIQLQDILPTLLVQQYPLDHLLATIKNTLKLEVWSSLFHLQATTLMPTIDSKLVPQLAPTRS
jgi:hypothetical protein